MRIVEILQDTNYKLTQFKDEYVEELESSIFEKKLKSGKAYYVKCLIRNRDIKLTPEEIVRQLFLIKLHKDYNYPYSRMQVEYIVHFGQTGS